jgi:hypothetical protein
MMQRTTDQFAVRTSKILEIIPKIVCNIPDAPTTTGTVLHIY